MSDSLLAKKYIDGIYIPAGLLVFGTILTKSEWAPYAALLALALGALKFFNMRMSCIISHLLLALAREGDKKKHGPVEQQHQLTTNLSHFKCRTQEGPEARPVPGVRAQGEDHHLPQCCHVCSSQHNVLRPTPQGF